MIEGEYSHPLLRGMARLACQVGLWLHSMRIAVAHIAVAGRKVELSPRIRRRTFLARREGSCGDGWI